MSNRYEIAMGSVLIFKLMIDAIKDGRVNNNYSKTYAITCIMLQTYYKG